MEKLNQTLRTDSFLSAEHEGNGLLTTAIRAVGDKKGANIVSIDLQGIDEAVADYFILCEANNPVQMQAICNHVEKTVLEHCGEKPYHIQHGEGWTLIDYIDIVVHIFKEEERKFYDLEGLWLDGKRTEHTA
ncbi:MAG TPA: ribosome silencing factor [Edaphocola sp.]|nr:ribosome silencing factor [Edaphocola sp.]